MKKIIGRIFLVLLLGFLQNIGSSLQAGDNRANATRISGSFVNTTLYNIGATKEAGEFNHGGNTGGASVWFVWTNTFGGNTPVLFSTEGSSFDTTMSIFRGNSTTPITTVDDAVGIFAAAQIGTVNFQNTYWIAVDGYNDGSGPAVGEIRLSVQVMPSGNLTSPANGANFSEGTPIPLAATGTARAGRNIQKVEFLAFDLSRGEQINIAEDTSSPYSFSWQNVLAGQYYVAAIVTDSAGASNFTSETVLITVGSSSQSEQTLLPRQSQWKYLHGPNDLGTAWRNMAFDDSAWLSGPAPLGIQDDITGFIQTRFSNYNPNYITTYFRRVLNVTNPGQFSQLLFNYARDDGLVVYVNGQEMFRDNLPLESDITYNSVAPNAISGFAEQEYYQLNLEGTPLVNGENIITAELHQNGTGSSDLTFDLEIIGLVRSGVQLTQPSIGSRYARGTNILLEASATAQSGAITQVLFYANTTLLGTDASAPYSFNWLNVPAGFFNLRAIARENNGVSYTSSVVSVTIEDPATNTAPRIVGVTPPPGAATNFGTFSLSFNEPVMGINASSILINGSPATKMYYVNSTNVMFSFRNPAPGNVTVELISTHNVTDQAVVPLRLDTTASGRTWNYSVRDGIPPVVARVTPAPGASIGSLSQIEVTFSKPVQGVNGADLLVNGSPASSVSGSGDTYTFSFLQPALGRVNITWANNHGISDLSDPPNGFNATAGSSTWSYTLEAPRVFLVQTNSTWSWRKGTSEASTPVSAWRVNGFVEDNTWMSDLAAFYYGDQWPNGTIIPDMQNSYTTLFLRKPFVVTNAAALEEVRIRAVIDDGFIIWVNGVEVARANVPFADPTFNSSLPSSVQEPIFYQTYNVSDTSMFLSGTNTIAVMLFNAGASSSDLMFDMEMTASVADPSLVAPTLISVLPSPGTEVTTLTSAQVRFSEPVQGVNAADLLINGVPAVGLISNGDTYTFTFTRPAFGNVTMAFAANHGITDFDSPPRAFDHTANASWNYTLLNPNAPFIAGASPAPNSTVGSLGLVQVVFNKAVTGVNASDFLVNGTPANSVSGSGSTYNFSFSLQPDGPVQISWVGNHGILDATNSQNAFNANSASSTWQYTVQRERTFLVRTNSLWSFRKGTSEASTPIGAWRLNDFVEDNSWEQALGGFSFGDPWPNGTVISDMFNNYTTIYLRKPFVVNNVSALENLLIRAVADDAFVVWVNGVEVARSNFGSPEPFYNSVAPQAANEPVSYQNYPITDTSMFVSGTNIFAVQVLNAGLSSSDLIFDIEMSASIADPSTVPPNLVSVLPTAGDVTNLTTLTVRFSEPVQGVNASDLLVNGAPATGLSGSGDTYTFTFARPAFGNITVAFAASHGITDFDTPNRSFDHTVPNATWNYWQINPSAPLVSTVTPGANSVVGDLAQVQVVFNKSVTGVDAGDLLINGVAATNVIGSGTTYTFRFAEPRPGTINFTWVTNHGIRDTDAAQNPFDATRGTATWQIILRDLVAPVLVSQVPAAGSLISNLTAITVNFSEPVIGVTANDLIINGRAATRVSGGGSTYVFEFTQPSASIITVTWSANHGITDAATPANPFNANAPGTSWTYQLSDNLMPVISRVVPGVGATVSRLTQLEVIFSEPVGGLQASDLLVNGSPASSLQGAGAGPYEFSFAQPGNGTVTFSWAANHGIHDFASPSNLFNGQPFTINLNTGMAAPNIVINEIMFNPASVNRLEEYIELRNNGIQPVNMAGWELTRGVSYLFPAVVIQPGGYLVVSANTNAFRTKYPGVNNVVGNWEGTLSNSREDIELSDPYGDRVDIIDYADEGDWAVRERRLDPNGTGTQGWAWFSAADGPGGGRGGRSMELRNPLLLNENGQNWLPSVNTDGTPGAVNSNYTNNIAPLILDTLHNPAVPGSSDFVFVTARIVDETSNPIVNLRWRNASSASPGNFQTLGMSDSGVAGDAVAGDGVYTAVVSPQSSGTIIEFYIEARDSANNTNTWPAIARMMDGSLSQAANAHFQFFDGETYSGTQPIHRLVFTEADRNALINMNNNSNSEINGTMITVDGTGVNIRYNVGVRLRGAGSRGANVNNYRVNVPTDRLWKGVNELNHNAQYTHAQVAGAAITQNAGAPTANARFIQVRINGVNLSRINAENGYGSWALIEVVNGDWADNHFPEDPNGNTYSARRPNTDLSYLGTNPQSYINQGYGKTSNQSENDWSDLINLTDVLNNAPNATYIAAIRETVNVENWLKFFAVGTLLGYAETALNEGTGDDYNMYRPILDPRMMLVLHDLDTVFGQGQGAGAGLTQSIWTGTRVAAIARFLRHPEITPLYYEELMRQIQTAFAPSNVNAVLDQTLGGHVPANVIESMKSFNVSRIANVLSQIPQTLTVNHSLSVVNGYPTATTGSISLNGSAPGVGTRAVLVNGVAATYTGWQTPNTWSSNVGLSPGLNRIKVQAVDQNGGAIAETILEVYYNDGDTATLSGILTTNRTLTASGGPYNINANLTVANGATLTILPGTTLLIGNGVNITVANGGILLAEGTPAAPIVFTRILSGGTSWGGIVINGTAGSPETRITHAHIVHNGSAAITSSGGTIYLDNLTFGTTSQRYLNVDGSSFIVSNCHFPATTGSIEGVHGTGGIKAGGVGLFLRNYFGAHTGYNDNNDFTGGNRPGPIVHFINNVFYGTGDDLLDLDGTDAWVEGNIFMRAHQNGSPDSASAISGGRDGTATSELTVIGNIFYDLDHAVLAKEGNFYTLLNNTIVRQTRQGGTDTDAAVIILADEGTTEGLGVYLEGNILYDIEKLTRHVVSSTITFTNNLMPLPWSGAGGGNSTENPGLRYVPQVGETIFANWQQAQVLWNWFSLTEGSPARGTGPNGTDKGAVNSRGVSIDGEPSTVTSATSVTLTVGPNRTGNGIPAAALPSGAGYTHYRWRLNGGTWSSPVTINTPIILNNLTNGTYVVEAVGRLDSGLWQDDARLGADAVISSSRSWIVNTQAVTVVLNEVLARNSSAVAVNGQFPDLLELHNPGNSPVNIGGLRLTDDITLPNKFVFPAGTTIPAGGYLIVYGDDEPLPIGHHLGFGFGAEGESLYLLAPSSDGRIIDQVHFGQQLQNFSIGRLANGEWSLTQPTFGAVNRAATTGVGNRVLINEWLAASGTIPFDFIELYNQEQLPVNIGGYHLSDEPIGAPWLHRIAPLTFIPAGGYIVFIADGRPADGPNHLNFSLASEQGAISLANREVHIVDILNYGPQRLNVSQGRQPNGAITLVFFEQPTPGSPNPAAVIPGGSVTINEVFANSGSTNLSDYVELYNPSGSSVSLAGYSLTDDTLNSRKYVFPAGVTIPPLGYLVIQFDNRFGQSATNTGFNISAEGGGIYLFESAANGGGLLSSVTFGLQAPAFSIGRIPNGTGSFTLNLPTANSANIAVALANPSSVKINEWMADPASGDDDWVELYNIAAQPVALGGMYISDNLSSADSRKKHRFPELSFIGVNEFLVLIADNNPAGGGDHVAFALSAGGESIGISDTNAVLLESVTFGAQIEGVSQGRLPDAGTNIVFFGPTQSPGESNYLPINGVVINEVLANSDAPYEDAIELYNTTAASINIGGWFLSDSDNNLRKFQIPAGTTIPAFGYIVFYENQFNAVPGDPNNFALSSTEGDNVVLSQVVSGNLTGYREQVRFGPSDVGISFGRHLTSVGADFTTLSRPTFGRNNPESVLEFRLGTGATNAYPLVGPVVVSQIMYRPPDNPAGVDNVRFEYLQLLNITSSTVPLFDPSRPGNTWRLRDAIDFEFPAGTSLAPGEQILVVSFSPEDSAALHAFRTNYNLGASVRIFGPYRDTLDNGNGTIELEKPAQPQPDGSVPYVIVERIRYADRAPWPSTPDGRGDALVRIFETQYGSDPANWIAAPPSPGPAEQDSDEDGMPDDWEIANGFNPNNPSDAQLDFDNDRMSNLNEYLAGTDPRSAASALRLASASQSAPGAPGIVFTFTAVANKSYSVQYRTGIGEQWQNLLNVAPGSARTVEVTDTPTDRMRFYRIVTPAQP